MSLRAAIQPEVDVENLVAAVGAAVALRRNIGKRQPEPTQAGRRRKQRRAISRPVIDQAATDLVEQHHHHPGEVVVAAEGLG